LASSAASTSGPGAYPPTAGAAQRGVERLPHLRCVCLVRPTDDSVEACARELREGRFGGYWLCASLLLPSLSVRGRKLVTGGRALALAPAGSADGLRRLYADFTNVLSKAQIEKLAEADEHELVREVQVRSPLLVSFD